MQLLKHMIKFNEDLSIFTDNSFVLEYLKYAEHFVRIVNFPFYYRGEVYDPFNGNTLSDQDFIDKFEDYTNSFFDAMQRTTNKEVKKFLVQRMKMKLKGFDPSLRDIKAKIYCFRDTLVKVVKALKWNIIKDGKLLYNLEIMFLSMDDIENARYVNELRKKHVYLKVFLQTVR